MNIIFLDPKAIEKAKKKSVAPYLQADILTLAAIDRLFENLQIIKINPHRILHLGFGGQAIFKRLKILFPVAHVMSDADFVFHYENLPFLEQQFDLIIANLNLHWCLNGDLFLEECFRVLKPQGLFMLTTVGPDTLKELRDSFDDQERAEHVHPFVDMHDIGDALLSLGFADPVMHVDYLEFHYVSVRALMQEIKKLGLQNALVMRCRGLMGKKKWQQMLLAYKNYLKDGFYPATVELIFGHAWKPEKASRRHSDEVIIPISEIRRSSKSN